MYINLDLVQPSRPLTELTPEAGDKLEFAVPNTKGNNWTICKIDVAVMQGSLVNNYDIRVIKRDGGLTKTLASSFEEHNSVSYKDINILDDNGSVKFEVEPKDNESLRLLVGDISIY